MPLTNPPAGPDLSGPLAFFGATPTTRRGPFTETYSTTSWALGAYTPNVQSSAYLGGLLDLLQAARLADLNTLRTAVENLRALTEATTQRTNALVADLRQLGLVA